MSEYPSEWSVRSLGEIAERVRRTSSDQNLDVLTISSTEGWVDQKRKWARDMAGKSIEKYTLLQQGEFSYNRGNSKTYPQGCVFRLESWDRALVPNVYHSFSIISPDIDDIYLKHFFSAGGLNDQLRSVITSSVRDNGLLNITADTFFASEIPVPPLPEQKKIAEILSGIDRTISDLRSKAQQITSCKHSVFSDLLAGRGRDTRQLKDGEWTIGVIGEADSIPCGWDIVNINDVARLESGHTPSRRCPEYWGGKISWISLADSKRLDRDYEITETNENTNNEGIANSSARLLPKGTVCLSRTASIGKCVIMGEEMATSQDFANFICGPRLHNYYLLFLFRYMQETWKMLSGGSTHQTIYMPIFQSLQIPVPTLAEQKSISGLMKSFDRTINATLAKKEKLVHIKKSLSADLLSGRKRVRV